MKPASHTKILTGSREVPVVVVTYLVISGLGWFLVPFLNTHLPVVLPAALGWLWLVLGPLATDSVAMIGAMLLLRRRVAWVGARERELRVRSRSACALGVAIGAGVVVGVAWSPLGEDLAPWYLLLQLVVITPVVEEVFFRGFLLDLLSRKMNASCAAVILAFAFAAFHLPNKNWFLVILGFLFSVPVLISREKGVVWSCVMHAIWNGYVAIIRPLG